MGEDREVARRHQMTFRRKTGRVDEGRFLEPDGSGVLGHLFGKCFFAAGDPFGENDGGIVARLDGDALDEIVHAHHGVERREHGRSAGRRSASPPRMLAHLELVLELEPPCLQLAEHDGERHQLAHARRRSQRIGVLLEQHEIGVGIHEDGVLGLGLEGAGGAAARTVAATEPAPNARTAATAAILIHLSRREACTGLTGVGSKWMMTAAVRSRTQQISSALAQKSTR